MAEGCGSQTSSVLLNIEDRQGGGNHGATDVFGTQAEQTPATK